MLGVKKTEFSITQEQIRETEPSNYNLSERWYSLIIYKHQRRRKENVLENEVENIKENYLPLGLET